MASVPEPKVVAAAHVVQLEALLVTMGDDPLFEGARKVLQILLGQTRKLAVDNRTDAKKLLDKEAWVMRESKRMVEERRRAAEQSELICKRQQILDKEIEKLALLKANLCAETGSMDRDDLSDLSPMDAMSFSEPDKEVTATTTLAEIQRLEARELEVQRWIGNKRKPDSVTDLTTLELTVLKKEADRLQGLQRQIRVK